MLVIYDTVSNIPDIIIVQVLEFVFITSTHLTCVPFLSIVAVKLKLVVSSELLFTRAAVNPVLPNFITCPEVVTIAMGLLFGREYEAATLLLV